VEQFEPGSFVDVTATSKGRGFQGGVKRHNFAGGPKTHGQSDRHRAPGSIGSGTTPGRVFKGLKMAGHMGAETVTVLNLLVVAERPVPEPALRGGLCARAPQHGGHGGRRPQAPLGVRRAGDPERRGG
jgi:ribosomal protein L3